LLALAIAIVWGLYGGIFFFRGSKKAGRKMLIDTRAGAA
jgi:hypothetical protein